MAAELAATSTLASPTGQQAIVLARRIDASDQDSGSAIAALSRQLEALRTRLRLPTGRADDPNPLSRMRSRGRRYDTPAGQLLFLPSRDDEAASQ